MAASRRGQAVRFMVGEELGHGSRRFHGDGKLDLAVANSIDGTVTVLLGDGKGGFAEASAAPRGRVGSLALGDFNGDGKLDLAVATSNSVTVLLGDGKGGFSAGPRQPIQGGIGSLAQFAVGDFNGDHD